MYPPVGLLALRRLLDHAPCTLFVESLLARTGTLRMRQAYVTSLCYKSTWIVTVGTHAKCNNDGNAYETYDNVYKLGYNKTRPT